MKQAALFLKALADEARLRILHLLLHHKELCVCELVEALGITQSKASRHLATLRHAGLVTDRKEGTWSYYKLCQSRDAFERAMLKTLLQHLGRRFGVAPIPRNRSTRCALPAPTRPGKTKHLTLPKADTRRQKSGTSA